MQKRYNRIYKEDGNDFERPISELSDSDFAIILEDGTKLYPMDNRDRAQSSINKLAQNLTPEQFKMAMNKIKTKWPGINPIEKIKKRYK